MLDKNVFIKLVFPSLIIVSLIITILPEIRLLGLIFFFVGAIGWFLLFIQKPQFLSTDADDNRYLQYFFYPMALFNIALLIFNQDYRKSGAGIIYLILSTIIYLVYMSFPNITIGIPKDIKKGALWGFGVLAVFFILNKISPTFSLLTPQLPFSLGEFARGIVIIGFAPALEAGSFRGALLPFLMTKFRLSFISANSIQASIFTGYHYLSYGIFLGGIKTLSEFFGATAAISGSLITAFVFALLVGYLVYRFKSLLLEYIPHTGINAGLFFTVLSAGNFFSIG